MKIFCVIPAWNEANNISEVIAKVKSQVDLVVVVDDGSSDDTVNLARLAGATVLLHPINRGQGAALRTGTQYALDQGADIIVHFDADNQFVATEISEVVAPIISGQVEAVFGSRFLGKENNLPPFKKKFILPLGRLFNLIFLGVKFTDSQIGFRALSASAAQRLDWRQDKMAHASEILWLTRLAKVKYKEVGVTVHYYEFGQRLSGGFKIASDLLLGRFLK